MGRMLIAGNWKMNGLQAMGLALAGDLAAAARGAPELGCELLVCPPAQLLLPIGQALAGSAIALGAQDCHSAEAGAHTGDISAAMLADAGCRYVIVGHSERRADHGETDGLVRAKAVAAQAAGLVPIVCLGETEDERLAGRTLEVVADQLAGSLPADAGQLVVAYEPVWAIGTGRSATPEDVRQVHGHLRGLLTARFGAAAGAAVRLLYGGSVKAANAAGLLAIDDVDGALVGGASLAAEEFWAIAGSCP